MPYIKKERRAEIAKDSKFGFNIEAIDVESVGELNFAITKLCLDFLERDGRAYRSFNEIVGVLECVKLEFYRKAVVPYEEEKTKENGDVY
jgi:hypothetical protein